jgi:hypothetical protein
MSILSRVLTIIGIAAHAPKNGSAAIATGKPDSVFKYSNRTAQPPPGPGARNKTMC